MAAHQTTKLQPPCRPMSKAAEAFSNSPRTPSPTQSSSLFAAAAAAANTPAYTQRSYTVRPAFPTLEKTRTASADIKTRGGPMVPLNQLQPPGRAAASGSSGPARGASPPIGKSMKSAYIQQQPDSQDCTLKAGIRGKR
ncbi:hypothetical protein BC829DRAFT_441519 [Chytridium lagenaria]|nr:hypothetical protein BC829DRAFT_441519 [Chytridium lagenaria]